MRLFISCLSNKLKLSNFEALFFLLAHLSHMLKVSFCDPMMSVRLMSICLMSVNNLLETTSPPKPLDGLSPNFTEMILGWFPFKVVQKILFRTEFWLP